MRDLRHKLGEHRFEGIGVCQGVSIGRAFLIDDPRGRIIRAFLPSELLDGEIERFHQALRVAQQQVQGAIERMRAALGSIAPTSSKPTFCCCRTRALPDRSKPSSGRTTPTPSGRSGM